MIMRSRTVSWWGLALTVALLATVAAGREVRMSRHVKDSDIEGPIVFESEATPETPAAAAPTAPVELEVDSAVISAAAAQQRQRSSLTTESLSAESLQEQRLALQALAHVSQSFLASAVNARAAHESNSEIRRQVDIQDHDWDELEQEGMTVALELDEFDASMDAQDAVEHETLMKAPSFGSFVSTAAKPAQKLFRAPRFAQALARADDQMKAFQLKQKPTRGAANSMRFAEVKQRRMGAKHLFTKTARRAGATRGFFDGIGGFVDKVKGWVGEATGVANQVGSVVSQAKGVADTVKGIADNAKGIWNDLTAAGQPQPQALPGQSGSSQHPEPLKPQDIEDCTGCKMVWMQVEMDVGNARFIEDVQASFEHNCMDAQKSSIYYGVCEDMYDDMYAMTDDYMSNKFLVEAMCQRARMCKQ